MRRFTFLAITIFQFLLGFSQTISPDVDVEQCPTLNFPNGAGYTYIITFNDNATKFSIGTKTNCEVSFYSTPYNNDTLKASVVVQFKDQSAGEHKFEVKKGSTVVKPFVFTKIKSIADRTLASVPVSVSAPLCSTTPVFVQFPQIKYRKTGSTSSTDEYGTPIPFYEYELPQGWQLTGGYVGQSSTPGLVVGTNNVTIQPDALSGGNIKVRAVNAQCGDSYKTSQWSTINAGRQTLNLNSAGSTSITINCGDVSPRTFTVDNGNLATCATFTWSTSGGWLDTNGQPVTSFTTNTPSVTLSPVSSLAQPPTDIFVEVKSGVSSFKDTVKVTFTNNKPNLPYLTRDLICSSEIFELQNIPSGANVTWTTSKSGVVQITTLNTSGSQAQISKLSNDTVTITANLNTAGCGTFQYPKFVTVGTPTVRGHYTIISNSHPSPGYQYPLGDNNSFFLPANQLAQLDLYVTNTDFSSVSWTNTGSYLVSWYPINNGMRVTFSMTSGPTAYQSKTTTFNSSASNTCGSAGKSFNFTVVTQGWSSFSMTTSPNPATNDMTVTISDESPDVKLLSREENVILELVELSSGKVAKQWKFKNSQRQFSLNVQGVRKGFYLLRASIGNHKETKQIIIGE